MDLTAARQLKSVKYKDKLFRVFPKQEEIMELM